MFSNDDWNSSQRARKVYGKDTKKKAFDNNFWEKVSKIVKIGEPLLMVLHLVDGEKLTTNYIHEAMDQAKGQIWATYKGLFERSLIRNGTINSIVLCM